MIISVILEEGSSNSAVCMGSVNQDTSMGKVEMNGEILILRKAGNKGFLRKKDEEEIGRVALQIVWWLMKRKGLLWQDMAGEFWKRRRLSENIRMGNMEEFKGWVERISVIRWVYQHCFHLFPPCSVSSLTFSSLELHILYNYFNNLFEHDGSER